MKRLKRLFCIVLVAAAAVFLWQRMGSKGDKLLAVPALSQYPQLPTGCEATAATMVLQYYGSSITPEEFASSWLECDGGFYTDQGVTYGPDPSVVFAGDPFSSYSYGFFAEPIAQAVNNNSTEYKAKTIYGKSLSTLCNRYIDQGQPLLIWATMKMREPQVGNSWYLSDGTYFTWTAGEHCLVLVGYDENNYLLNDPQTGSVVAYPKEVVQARFDSLGSQAVCISLR